jgi:uncharacterized membrane protein YccF (DUF307 family)
LIQPPRAQRASDRSRGTAAARLAHAAHTEGVIRLILNLLWLVFGSGIALAIGYGIAALICFALIVTIPFGVAALRLAYYSLWPFGRTLVTKPTAGLASGLANILWILVAGWWLALAHVLAGIAQCVTIIGIPFGIANFKLVPAAFWPLGRQVVDLDQAEGAPPAAA